MSTTNGWKWERGRGVERFLAELATRAGLLDPQRGRPSQAQLAAAFSLHQQTVQAWAAGKRSKAPPYFRVLLHDYAQRYGWDERALRERWQFVRARVPATAQHVAFAYAQRVVAAHPALKTIERTPSFRLRVEQARREVDEVLSRLGTDLRALALSPSPRSWREARR